MPGSIQVSVLDFKELPSSSNVVKVSLGKVEHEAEEKGTFSFPLTNLRDNLIISIQDSEGNQVSHSGVRTMSIIEKGTWDDLFPIEGGGIIHMKLQFVLSDEERNRIRSMRESAMKKKQAEILGSRLRNSVSLGSSLNRLEVSDVLRAKSSQDFQRSSSNRDAAKARFLTPFDDDTSVKAAEVGNLIKEEAFQRQLFTNATDRREETSLTNLTTKKEAETPKQNLEEKVASKVKKTSEESTSTPLLQETKVNSSENNEIPSLQQVDVPERLQESASQKAKKNDAAGSKPLDNEKLEKQNLEEKVSSFVKKASKEVTEVNTIRLEQADIPKRVEKTSSQDVGSSRSIIAEKIKSFSPALTREADKQNPLEKTPRNIKKMISVFESSISQDRVPIKPLSTKSYKVGTLSFLKDNNSETSSSTRLRNSFSTGDLRKDLSSIITKEDQDGFDNDFVEPNMQSKGHDPKETENNEKKFAFTETKAEKIPFHDNTKHIKKEDGIDGRKSSKVNVEYFDHGGSSPWMFLDDKRRFCMTTQGQQEKGEMHRGSDVIAIQGEEMVNVSGHSSPKSTDDEASDGSIGQVIKIALVVGFGILVILFRQREPGKGKKKENVRVLKNQVFLSKRGSIEEHRRKVVARKLL